MNRRSFRTLRLPGGCIRGTKDLENYIGATQQTAPPQEEEQEQEDEEEDDDDPIGRQGVSEATARAARYRDTKLANDCLDSTDLQM